MSQGPGPSQLRRLERAARAAGRRQKLNLALHRLARLLPVPLAYAVLATAFVRWAEPSATVLRVLAFGFMAALLVPCVGVLAALWRRRSPSAGALALDRFHQSADRVTNALAFAKIPPAARSPFMEAAISDALSAVEKPNASQAVPVELPRRAWLSAALGIAIALASRLEPPPRIAPVAPPALATVDPVALSADDVALLRDSAEALAASADHPELAAAVSRFNQLVEDIAERRIDRRELFTRLMEIERSLSTGSESDAAVDEALQRMAEELEKSALSRPIAKHLAERQLPEAEQELRELAEKLREQKKIDRAELERLRKALESSSEQAEGRVQRLEAARRSLEAERRRLLQKKKDDKQAQPGQRQTEAERQRRRLERLDRDIAQAKQAREELSALDRELAEAARNLMQELGDSAKHLEAGAEDINRMARQKMTEQEKRELERQLEELRELLRQSGPGKEEHLRRLSRFAERARGQKGGGQRGQKPGEQPGGKGGERLTLGPGGRPIPMPLPGGDKPGSPGPSGADPGGGSGSEAGAGRDSNVKGPPTDLDGKTEDVTAAAIDTGQGAASSEVVYSAAERGFASRRYQNVYTQYRTVAEDVLEQDTIPAGYEFYVRRYFQLIRPRDATGTPPASE